MQVLQYLSTHTLTQLKEELGIKVSQNELYPYLYVLNYDQINSPKAHPIVVECRSLVLESLDGVNFTVVSRSFDRFFNYGECDYSPDISTITCYEKLDGSLIGVFWYNGEWLYRTKSMIMPLSSVQGYERTWKEFIESALDWSNLPTNYMYMNKTYIFEVVGRENRVVVNYEEDGAYLLAIRDNITGAYLDTYTTTFKRPRIYSFKSTSECLESVKNLPNLEEGYVGYNEHGVPCVKIKSPSYLVAHRIKGEGLTPSRIAEMVVINEYDEYLSIFPEDEKHFTKYILAWGTLLEEVEFVANEFINVVDRKEFALKVKDYSTSAVLFQHKTKGGCVKHIMNDQKTSYKVKLLLGDI
jgi:T4 RnlA family RNA ligase